MNTNNAIINLKTIFCIFYLLLQRILLIVLESIRNFIQIRISNKVNPIKDQDFDIETDMNIFYDINSMNIEKEEKKNLFGENKEILIQDI